MDRAEIRRWAFFFISILCAIVIADTGSNAILSILGMSGPARFITGFIVYAVLLFATHSVIEILTGNRFFGFRP